jgi:thioredoxin-like negative regulator of GroEL
VDGALEDSGEAISFARQIANSQHLFPAIAARARVLLEAGRDKEALRLVDELLEQWRERPTIFATSWIAEFGAVAAALGREQELGEAVAHARVTTRWLEAALAYAQGKPAEAARVYAQIGSQPDEAHARLRAAEALVVADRRSEAEDELTRALEFYRRVGATRMVREAEALLAPTSS